MIILEKENSLSASDLPIIEVTSFTMEEAVSFRQKLLKLDLDSSVNEIFMYIDTYGGEVWALISMLETLKNCSKPVNSVVTGFAQSCGFFLSICTPGTRYISKSGSIHAHNLFTGGCSMELPKVITHVTNSKKMENKLLKLMSERTGMRITNYRKQLKENGDEWQISSKEALELGFCDVIGLPKFRISTIVESY